VKRVFGIIILLSLVNCKNIGVDPDEGRVYVRLQNQTEHSGIMVEFTELNRFTLTDSLGYFSFDDLPNGIYTLHAKYPYFRPEHETVLVKDGKIQTPVNLELKQLLQFWVEPPETTISMSNLGNPDWFSLGGLRQYLVNITTVPVRVGTYLGPVHLWALVPQGFDWPYVSNSDNRPDFW